MDDRRLPILEHFQELFVRIRRAFLWFVAAFMASYAIAPAVIGKLQEPLRWLEATVPKEKIPQIITTRPFEVMWTTLSVSVYGAIIFALPMLAFEAARFVFPGLKPRERRRIWQVGLSFYVCFSAGIFLGWSLVIPQVFAAILRFSDGTFAQSWTLSAYVDTTIGVLLVTGVLIQVPVTMVLLSLWGVVKPETWASNRRYFVVANAAVAAVLSPPDALSMLLMMIPVQILYEAGIWVSRMARWGHDEGAAQ